MKLRRSEEKERWAAVPDDKEILELAKQVQTRGWKVMQEVLEKDYQRQLKESEDE